MALTNSEQVDRMAVPGEDHWIDLRPLNLRVYKALQKEVQALQQDGTELTVAELTALTLQKIIAGWSYPVPVTPDTIDDLEMPTFRWLQSVIEGRSLVEKKDSNGSLPPTTAPAKVASQRSSPT